MILRLPVSVGIALGGYVPKTQVFFVTFVEYLGSGAAFNSLVAPKIFFPPNKKSNNLGRKVAPHQCIHRSFKLDNLSWDLLATCLAFIGT